MLWLQAKQVCGKLSAIYQASETEVNKVAAKVPPFDGTSFTSDFLTPKSRSWQGHLEQISYLFVGEGVWWYKYLVFHDGDADPDYHPGPELRHFHP